MNNEYQKGLISVLVPLYNHEKYIQETIRSLITQTHKEIELIVINDGSPDDSHQRMQEIEKDCVCRFFKYTYINKENEGLVKTLNRAITFAQGEFLYIIASDDVAEKDALSTLYEFLSKNPDYGLAVGGNTLIDGDSNVCYWSKNREIVYSKEEAAYLSFDDQLVKSRYDIDFDSDQFGEYGNILRGNHIPNGYLLDKRTIDEIGGYSESSPLEDLYLMLQISKRKKMKFIRKPLFRYRWHGSNSIKNNIAIGQLQQQTIRQERGYCFRNGFFVLWLKRAYLPAYRYYSGKIRELLS